MKPVTRVVFLGRWAGFRREGRGGERRGRGRNVVAVVPSCLAMSLRVGSLVAAGGRGLNVKRQRKRQEEDNGKRSGTRRRVGTKNNKKDEEEKQLIELMNWVTDQIDQASRVPCLSDVVEQAVKGFGFRGLSCRVISAALR